MNARIESSVEAGLRHALLSNTSLMQSADFKEAIAAFLEKRSPSFKGL
jgi:enoyl-CoA hydratase/carnithine racemase